MDTLAKEMNEVRHKIAATEAKLFQAEKEGKDELILMYGNLLLELQKKENRLMQAAG